MLSVALNLPCSKRCELLLALAFLLSPESLVAIAHRLANDRHRSAIKIATALASMPVDRARDLALRTLAASGMSTECSEERAPHIPSIIEYYQPTTTNRSS